jgi:exodeoxyribonuclease VII small subunit
LGDLTFEELMEQLEGLTAKLAAGDLGIEAAADLYERAQRLHALAAARLDQVRVRVEGMTGGAAVRGQGETS